ncbi:MAG TPA: type II secretion system F family protein, partial [Planctomycetota bacterium]|nr:type II secretion system F family protein [Planctomycetota bacterium]
MSSRRAELYHSLSVMLESGVPLVRALRLASGSARGRLGRAFLELAEAAGRGEALADAMTVHPEVFAPLEVLV